MNKEVLNIVEKFVNSDRKHLDLSNRNLEALDIIAQKVASSKLRVINLRNNNLIKDISLLIKFKDSLEEINLSGTGVVDISLLSSFSKLQVIDLSNTEISDLSALNQLQSLERVIAYYSKFEDLRQIDELLSKNGFQISFEKDGIDNGIYLLGCKLKPITQHFIKKYPAKDDLVSFLKEVKNTPLSDITKKRLFIIGQPEVGKTTLAKRLKDIKYFNAKKEEATKGIDFIDIQLNKELQAVRVWDFAGQEIYKYTHRIFLTSNSLYILVDTDRDDENTGISNRPYSYWLPTLKEYAPNSKLIIVVNDFDNVRKQLEEDELNNEYNSRITYHYFNIKNDELETLKSDISKNFNSNTINTLFTKIPSHWREAEEKLLEQLKDKEFINKNVLSTKCKEIGISNSEFSYFLRYLAHQGIVTHFEKNNLRDTVFFNNNWISKAAFRIYENRASKESGVLSKRDIREIWDENYDEIVDKIEAIVVNFALAIPLQTSDKSKFWIIPKLLPNKKLEWKYNSNDLILKINFQSDFSTFLFEILRKAKRYFHNIDDVSRSSFIIGRTDKRARARIKYNKNLNQIEVRVTGDFQREFLFLIEKWFSELSKSVGESTIQVACYCQSCRRNPNKQKFYSSKNLIRKYKQGITKEICEFGKNEILDTLMNSFVGTLLTFKSELVSVQNNPVNYIDFDEDDLSDEDFENLVEINGTNEEEEENSIEVKSVYFSATLKWTEFSDAYLRIKNKFSSKTSRERVDFFFNLKSNSGFEDEFSEVVFKSDAVVLFLNDRDFKNGRIVNKELLLIKEQDAFHHRKLILVLKKDSTNFLDLLNSDTTKFAQFITFDEYNDDFIRQIESKVSTVIGYDESKIEKKIENKEEFDARRKELLDLLKKNKIEEVLKLIDSYSREYILISNDYNNKMSKIREGLYTDDEANTYNAKIVNKLINYIKSEDFI